MYVSVSVFVCVCLCVGEKIHTPWVVKGEEHVEKREDEAAGEMERELLFLGLNSKTEQQVYQKYNSCLQFGKTVQTYSRLKSVGIKMDSFGFGLK